MSEPTILAVLRKLDALDIIPEPSIRLEWKLELIDRHIDNCPELSDLLSEVGDALLSNPF